VRATYGAGGWYCASVYDQTVPRRDSSASSNSSPVQPGLRQKPDARGKNTVPHAVQRDPSSAGSDPVVNQPSMAGVAVMPRTVPSNCLVRMWRGSQPRAR
jgi:hypothetical protein